MGTNLLQTPGRMIANSQTDIVNNATRGTGFKEEILEHQVCDLGFVEQGPDGFQRMTEQTFFGLARVLLSCRPSAHLVEVKPEAPYREEFVAIKSPEAFKMTIHDRAKYLANYFARDESIIGFKMELHGVAQPGASCTLSVYKATEDFGTSLIPVTVKIRYRYPF